METRIVTEIKTYTLSLNPMMDLSHVCHRIAMSYEKQKLIDWYYSQIALEPYIEDGVNIFSEAPTKWYKVFKKDSKLEWYNPCLKDFELDSYGNGIREMWFSEEAIRQSGILLID